MLDVIGKRFLGYLVTLVAGFAGARFVTDGVQLEHFYTFSSTLFGIYVAGQSVTDSVAFFKGLKTLLPGGSV